MIGEWIEPILEWSGLALVPFLLIVVILVLIVKGD